MKNNIFLAIEDYLVAPSHASLENIKNLSHELAKIAYEQARVRYPEKVKISGDDFMPFLKLNIFAQAEEAYPVSTRLINNAKVTDNDPAYIFRLSEAQKNMVLKLQNELVEPTSKRSPHGLVFAYVGIIERRKSMYHYCEGLEAIIRDQNTLLRLKADDLSMKGHSAVAAILRDTNSRISELCKHYPQTKQDSLQFMAELEAILLRAKDAPEIKEYQPINTFICNFLLVISVVGIGYLASTTNKRGTFWFRPRSNIEKQLECFMEKSQALQVTDMPDEDSHEPLELK